jgi:hypothetical protein
MMSTIKYNSPCLLSVAQYCPVSPSLSRQHGVGRVAVVSQAFHACCSAKTEEEKVERDKLLSQLTDKENEAIQKWKKPTLAVFPKFKVEYDNAETEIKMALSREGKYLPYESEDFLTRGRMDMGWPVDLGRRSLAVIADIKSSLWTTSDPDNLQNIAYGLMYADKYNCDMLICGIWGAQEGKWNWGSEWDMLWDKESLLKKVAHAATNTSGQAVTGPHCRECWARLHCPEHCMTSTSDFEISKHPTETEIARLLLKVQAVEDQVKQTKAYCYECARRFDGLRLGDRVFSPRAYRWLKVKENDE